MQPPEPIRTINGLLSDPSPKTLYLSLSILVFPRLISAVTKPSIGLSCCGHVDVILLCFLCVFCTSLAVLISQSSWWDKRIRIQDMFCWGEASEGQLGLGGIEEEHVLSPRFADTAKLVPSKVKEIVCGWNHTAFLTVEGTVYTCGNNDFGQLGKDKSQTKPGERWSTRKY